MFWFLLFIILPVISFGVVASGLEKIEQRRKGRDDAIKAYDLTGVIPKIPKSDSKDYLEGFKEGLEEVGYVE